MIDIVHIVMVDDFLHAMQKHIMPGSPVYNKTSPNRARLYLFSLTPRIPAVIILKNAESGPEQIGVLRREFVRSYLPMLLQSEK